MSSVMYILVGLAVVVAAIAVVAGGYWCYKRTQAVRAEQGSSEVSGYSTLE